MRNTRDVEITATGRDKGKKFRLTEMPAMQSEKWAARAILALGRAGLDIPPDFRNAGLGVLAAIGIRSLLQVDFRDAEPLLDEMWEECVQIVETHAVRKPTEDDIEEATTITKLRVEVLELHTGFSLAEFLSRLNSATPPKD